MTSPVITVLGPPKCPRCRGAMLRNGPGLQCIAERGI